MDKQEYAQNAKQHFTSGLNCAQSVVMAFSNLLSDASTSLKIAAPFGGGMGRLRETCGTVTGAFIVIGELLSEKLSKAELYEKVQEFAENFKKQNGSIVCRELLNLAKDGADSPTPEPRTESYYKRRPCGEYVYIATEILYDLLKSNGIEL